MGSQAPEQAIQAATPIHPSGWKDRKRHLWMLGAAQPVIGAAMLAAYAVAPKKLRALAWAGPVMHNVIIPALDQLIGEDTHNPPEDAIPGLEQDPYYNRLVKAFIPTQFAVTLFGCWAATRKNVPLADRIGIAMSVGTMNGLGINTAHELGHKQDSENRNASLLALAPTFYTHFRVEHNYGHHKRVATPEDPASSRMGESFWKFLPRTVIGSLKSAIDIEKQRLERKGKSFWSLENELLQGWAISAGLVGAATAICGPRAIPFMVAQGAYGASLLEVVNYLEHYGLKRRQDENGKYERTLPEHSWNSNFILSNLLTYHLQRHSDHHANPTRSYQSLRHFETAPRLPAGYPAMWLAAYIPPLWYKIMDPKLVAHYRGDLSRINLDPQRRAELLAKYGQSGTATLSIAAANAA
ncbi:alkane 1-monooxygenase [Fluviicoccus keumensis]|nr:alkane 1-monooxygenase [Fluviicoccus keumensis]